jgi:hypothetical protein
MLIKYPGLYSINFLISFEWIVYFLSRIPVGSYQMYKFPFWVPAKSIFLSFETVKNEIKSVVLTLFIGYWQSVLQIFKNVLLLKDVMNWLAWG